MDWHAIIERAVDRNAVPATLLRYGDPDAEATLTVSPISYRDVPTEAGGSVRQQIARWMVPARRLAATTYPLPPREGDMLLIPDLGLQARVTVADPGFAGGDLVRWDLTVEGL
jgi:hypothetical protein